MLRWTSCIQSWPSASNLTTSLPFYLIVGIKHKSKQNQDQMNSIQSWPGASNLTTSQLFLFIDHIGVSAWAKLTNPASLTQDAQSQIKAQEEDKSVKKGGQPFQLLLFETLSSVLTLVRDKFSKKHLKDLLRDLHAELVGADDGDGGGKASKSDPFSDSTTISDSCYAICKELQKQWNKIIRTKDSARKWSEGGANSELRICHMLVNLDERKKV